MPGPFPGMDPYLENPYLWPGFHNNLIAHIEGDLNASLPSGLAANSEERVYLIPVEQSIIPDIYLHASKRPDIVSEGRTALMERDHGIISSPPETEREIYITIRSVENWEDIITIIEVLSPSNKRKGSVGRRKYIAKQQEILLSSTNLVEIDLLRGGEHTVSAPRWQLELYGKWDCLMVAHRPRDRWHFEYWLNRLETALPRISIPLTEELPDFELDLQAAFDKAYDAGPYKRRVDYSIPPTYTAEH